MEGPPGRAGTSSKMKTSHFPPASLSRGPLGPKLGPPEPQTGPLRTKIDPCRPDMGPPKLVHCLFSLNSDSERLWYLIVSIENGTSGSESGEKFHPFYPPCLRHFLGSRIASNPCLPSRVGGCQEAVGKKEECKVPEGYTLRDLLTCAPDRFYSDMDQLY